MKAEELKERLDAVLQGWIGERVDAMLQGNQQISPVAGNYLRKGVTNMVARSKDKIGGMVDALYLFLADEEGEIDMETLLDDASNILRNGKESTLFENGLLALKAGGGNILKAEAKNPVLSFLTGGTTALKLDENDIRGLKAMISGE